LAHLTNRRPCDMLRGALRPEAEVRPGLTMSVHEASE